MADARTWRHTLLRSLHALLLASVWVGCGGGSDPGPTYALTIDGSAQRSTVADRIVLAGSTFVPEGSTCLGGGCGMFAPLIYGHLGPYQLTWANAANGLGGPITATWVCNCDGGAPYWTQDVPLAIGLNTITVMLSTSSRTDQAVVSVTRL